MSRKNPFRIIRIAAATVAGVVVAGFVGLALWAVMSESFAESGPAILWQVPLALIVVLVAVVAVAFVCSLITELWKKAERNWDRRGE